MPPFLSVINDIIYSTIRVVCRLSDGMSIGTGFFFNINNNGVSIPVIVTNKHVVDGSIHGTLIFNKATSEDEHASPIAEQVRVEIDDFREKWVFHPDANVDLCVLPLTQIIDEQRSHNNILYYKSLPKTIIPSVSELQELNSIEDIVMIGYPIGIWDRLNNLPIVRRGITATPAKVNYMEEHKFIIDAATFPGSSGSPVLILNPISASRPFRDAIVDQALLLGILYAGFVRDERLGYKIVDIPTRLNQPVVSSMYANLGVVIKSNRLLDFEDRLS